MKAGGETGKRIGWKARIFLVQIRLRCGREKYESQDKRTRKVGASKLQVICNHFTSFPLPGAREENRYVQVCTQLHVSGLQ